MKNTVIPKSYKDGIAIYLDDTLEFEQLCLDLADKVVHSIISPASIPAFYCYHCKPSCIKMQEQPEKIAELFLDAGTEIL